MAQTTRDPAEIRQEIERTRQELDASVAELRADVAETLDWRNMVRRHPAVAFGGALALGYLLAKATRR